MNRLLITIALLATTASAHAAGVLTAVGSTQTPIQIRSHEVSVVIDNGFARTEVIQLFYNPNAQDLEAIYSFPLPQSSSLSEITIWNGDRELNGEVVEANEARKIYREERDAGNDAGLGECSCTKPKDDVEYSSYKFSVSPVKAQSDIKLRFVYYQPLSIDNGIGRYVYPLEEGGTDEAAQSFWTRNPKVDERFVVNVELKSGWPVEEVRVPGAEAEAKITKLGEGHFKVALDRQTGELSRDFVFYYRLAPDLPGRVELLAHKPDANKPGTFMMVVTPGVDLAPTTGGADYIFVLDRSSSMSGKLRTLTKGITQTLGQMKPGDRFRIITFNDGTEDLTRGFVSVDPQNVGTWTQHVESLTSAGGTNIYAGLSSAFDAVEADRATSIILVTDGVTNQGIVDPAEFRRLIKQHDVRIFGFVMGNNANWPLMRLIAEASGGFYAGVSNDEDVVGQILLARSKITSEALHDAQLKIAGVKTFDTTDGMIGKIYRGQQLLIFGRYDDGGAAKIALKARLTGQDATYETEFDFPNVENANPELERMWALHRIEQLELQESAGLVPPQEAEQAIRDIGLKYQLVTDYTSMVVLADSDFTKRGVDATTKRDSKTSVPIRPAEQH